MSLPSMDDRLRSLALRGFAISLTAGVAGYGDRQGRVEFRVRLTKGQDYGEAGMAANGSGLTLDEAAGAALRAAESFLDDPAPSAAVISALGDMAALPAPA